MTRYLFQILERAPKKFRYSWITRLENKSLDVVESLYAANIRKLGDPKRREEQEKTRLSLFVLDYEANVAVECGCLTLHQGKVLAKSQL